MVLWYKFLTAFRPSLTVTAEARSRIFLGTAGAPGSHPVVKAVLWSRGGSPDEARLEQTPYPFQPQLIWRYLGIKITLYRFNQGAHTIAGGWNGSRGWTPWPLTVTTARTSKLCDRWTLLRPTRETETLKCTASRPRHVLKLTIAAN